MSPLRTIIFRGDHATYQRRDGRFPYVDHAAQAGATGVHIWFWGEPYRTVQDDFIRYCHRRGLTVHLGIGVGAYGVCDGQDPTAPHVREQIEAHVAHTLAEQDVDGLEFQMGEYDALEYQGESAHQKTRARQVIDALNPIVDRACRIKPELWVRTELWTIHFAAADVAELAADLDPRCTVEWSDHTGPFRGPDALARGRELLAASERFSWFLKIYCDPDTLEGEHWRELAADDSPGEMRRWVEHWRGWVSLLHQFHRPTLTIIVDTGRFADTLLPLPVAAVALARDPTLPTEDVLAMLYQPGTDV
jgi:hypothetical protein